VARIDDLFRHLKEKKGSDLHLRAELPPRIRIHGSLVDVEGWPPLAHEELLEMLGEIAEDEQWESYESCGDLDFAYSLAGTGRFRANFLRQETGAGAVFRLIPEKILSCEDLGMPEAISNLAHLQQGLVLITGPTGSGKSTTMAAVINKINETYVKHVVTIEDPVEFVHQNKLSVFSHREIGHHTHSFSDALKVAVRQDSDVILVGEMRDLETISLAVTAAEMGTLVFGTLHTNSAAKTIDRLVDAFPAKQQDQIRVSLAESIAAIVAQLLLPTADGQGRVAAHEILLKTSGLPNIIREGNTPMLISVIQGGKKDGMCAMDDTLAGLVKKGKVTAQDAYMKANDKVRFQNLMKAEGGASVELEAG